MDAREDVRNKAEHGRCGSGAEDIDSGGSAARGGGAGKAVLCGRGLEVFGDSGRSFSAVGDRPAVCGSEGLLEPGVQCGDGVELARRRASAAGEVVAAAAQECWPAAVTGWGR